MLIHVNLSEADMDTIIRSKVERYGGEDAGKYQYGFELGTLIDECRDQTDELAEILEHLETSSDTPKKQIAWRIRAESHEILETLEASLNTNKSELIRAIIRRRLRKMNDAALAQDDQIEIAAWNLNAYDGILPVKIAIDEIMRHETLDLMVYSGYSRAALGRTDFRVFFEESEKYNVFESPYKKDEGFAFVYNRKRFRVSAESFDFSSSFFYPLALHDKQTGKNLVIIGINIPRKAKVLDSLVEVKDFIEGLQQDENKTANLVLIGNLRVIPSYIIKNRILPGSLAIERDNAFSSYVYSNNWRNCIDNLVTKGFQATAEILYDFLEDSHYHELRSDEHIDLPGYPTHGLIYGRLKYYTDAHKKE